MQRPPEITRQQAERAKSSPSPNTPLGAITETKRRCTPGIGTFKQWMRKNSIATDIPLLRNESTTSSYENLFAHNALLHVRSKNWSLAYENAERSVGTRPSTIGYIAKALAQIGNGEPEKAIQAFDLAFWNCDPDETNLLLLIKTIIFFEAGKQQEAISRLHDLIAAPGDPDVTYCCHLVLAKMYTIRNAFELAVHSLERAQGCATPAANGHLESISLSFRWSFEGLEVMARQRHCQSLYTAGRTEEAAEALRKMLKDFDEEIRGSSETVQWITDFKNVCIDSLQILGDEALSSQDHDKAIARYSSALSLDPSNPVDIFLKRSKARASKGLWKDALMDADEVIKLDPSSHRGYERKYMALRGAEDYDGAVEALQCMFLIIQQSPDEDTRRLQENYTTSLKTIHDAIDTAIQEIFALCPLVLIDVTTGRLCDEQERIRIFKSDTPFKKLVCEMATTRIDPARIRQFSANYFKWVMFSHTWDGKEPTFQDVNLVNTVWELAESPLNKKLHQFCSTARTDGFRWAWSDTCCIDKLTSAILSRSLISMYTWYERAAATLVYLADVLSSSELGALTMSRWMTRAWTLQELLASKVVRFYDRDWKPYLNDTRINHKESPAIMEELAQALKVPQMIITAFRPDGVGVRERLRLASTRKATEVEDVAYSLIGIFSSDILPRYGIGNKAIGLLLEGIVDRSGDVTVIAWTGVPSSYNSALPTSLVVYSRIPYGPPPMAASELDTQVEHLRTHFSKEDATKTYDRVVALGRATFSNRCLRLPCIGFSVTKIRAVEIGKNGQQHVYVATAQLLGDVRFRTVDAIPLESPRKLVFVHPWKHDLIDPYEGSVSDGDPEVEVEIEAKASADPEEPEAESSASSRDTSVPPSPVQANLPSSDPYTRGLRLIARLARPFNALLLEQQKDGRYRRVATDEEIIGGLGTSRPVTPKKLKGILVKMLEII